MTKQVQHPSVRVPDGEYIVKYVSHEIRNLFGKPKFAFYYEIIHPAEHQGKVIVRYYNIQFTKDGRITAGSKTDYVRDIYRINPDIIIRLDQLPIYPYKQNLRVKTCTVTKDAKEIPLAEPSKYSRIYAIIGVAEPANIVEYMLPGQENNPEHQDCPF